jgi:hypothetical protein
VQAVHDRYDRQEGGEYGKCPDMTDLLDNQLAENSTQYDTQVVCRHDQADDMIVITIEPHIDCQQTVHESGSHRENGRRQEKRYVWFNDIDHYGF